MVTSDVAGQFCGMADSIRLVKCLVNDSQTYRIVPSLRPKCLLQAGTESGATRFGGGEIAGRRDEGFSRPVKARAIANSRAGTNAFSALGPFHSHPGLTV
jgi:hypothetical protein